MMIGAWRDDGPGLQPWCGGRFETWSHAPGVGVGSSRAEVIAAYGEPSSDQSPKPKFEILHYNKPTIRFFLQNEIVDYIVLDLPKAR